MSAPSCCWNWAVCLMAAAAATSLPAQVRDFSSFARDLIDLESLARVEFVPTRMESSYDRTGGNQDGFLLENLRDDVYTIAELKGPGVIRRFYAGTPGGHLRIFIDGDPMPVIDMPCKQFFSGGREPFLRPLVGPMGGSNYSYFPIPYARSIRIQTTGLEEPGKAPSGPFRRFVRYGLYYQVTFQTFPADAQIRSLKLPLSASEQGEWKRTIEAWRSPGRDPKPSRDEATTTTRMVRLAPGEVADLADVQGPGVIDRFYLKLEPQDPALLRSTLLRMRWDEERYDAVDCPVGDFFGNGFSRVPYKSLPMGLTERGYYSYFSMPFGSRARVSVLNESPDRSLTAECTLVYRRTAGLPSDLGYFHAKWRREETAAVNLHGHNRSGEYNYRILDVRGQGRYIGTNLNVFNRHLTWWGEGDPMIFVDNEVWPPSLHGTGTEEYFNDGWDFHQYIVATGADPATKEQNVIPVSGVLIPGIVSPANCYGGNAVFVFHLADSFPFRQRILVTIEHGTANNLTNDYASTAYWYARPGATDFFLMRPPSERIAVPRDQWEKNREEAVKKAASPRTPAP